jgi:DNA-binding transcriptional MerR regulator
MDGTYRDRLLRDGTKPAEANTEIPPVSCDAERISIGELARDAGVTLRALRFYQSKGLLMPQRDGTARIFSSKDRARLNLIQQGKRLGFTLCEIRDMVVARAHGCVKILPVSRKKCVEQIKLLEHQRRDIDRALAELRQIYTGMFVTSDVLRAASERAAESS